MVAESPVPENSSNWRIRIAKRPPAQTTNRNQVPGAQTPDRRIRAADFRVGGPRAYTQMVQFCASAASAGGKYSQRSLLCDIGSLLFGQRHFIWVKSL